MKTRYTRKPTQEELYRLYINDRKTLTEIGNMFETSPVTARNWLKSAHIKLRSSSDAQLKGVLRPSNGDLKKMYIDDNMTTVEIGERVGVGNSTIGRWMKRAGIPMKTPTNARLRNCTRPTNDELFMWYVSDGKTVIGIADMLGVSDGAIKTWLIEADIHVRSHSEAQLHGKQKPTVEELYRLYIDENCSAREVADVFGVSDVSILLWLDDVGIPKRTTSESLMGKYVGEKNPNWSGGPREYCYLFNYEFKEKIRDRFGRKCFLCGKTEEDNGVRLSVHHTNFDKRCLCNDIDCRFVPLCMSCHGKTNGDKSYWTSVIMCKLYLEISAQFVNIDLCI